MADTDKTDLVQLTVQLLSSYLSNNIVAREDLADLIRTTRTALSGEISSPTPPKPDFVPAVSVRKSLASPDHILSLIDGKPYKMLKRHLSQHGLTPAQYRERYDLPRDYPMTAKAYSDERRATAARIGLGSRKPLIEPKPLPSAGEQGGLSVSTAAEGVPSPAPTPSSATENKTKIAAEASTGAARGGRKLKTQAKPTPSENSGGAIPKGKGAAPEAETVPPAKIASEKTLRRSAAKKPPVLQVAASPVEGDATSVKGSSQEATPSRAARKKPALKTNAPASKSERGGRKPKAVSAQATDQKAEGIVAPAPSAPQFSSPSPAMAAKTTPTKGRRKTASAKLPVEPKKVVPAEGQPARKARKTLKIKTGD